MNLPAGLDLGAATHTGLIRSTNEDDYLVIARPDATPPTLLCALADGMGGAAGGAEASRAALHAFGAEVLAVDSGEAAPRLARGVAAACRRVHEQAVAVPALRDMGTTLTGLLLCGPELHVAHVGDTRAYRWRAGELLQLTQDHALREPDNVLTRCIGGGQFDETPDIGSMPLQPGDRLALLSDGAWSTVPAPTLARLLGSLPPQAAADEIVRQALVAGGPDNATVVVVHVGDPRRAVAVDLPKEELARAGELVKPAGSLRAPVWPWVVLGLAAVIAMFALARWYPELPPFAWLHAWWG